MSKEKKKLNGGTIKKLLGWSFESRSVNLIWMKQGRIKINIRKQVRDFNYTIQAALTFSASSLCRSIFLTIFRAVRNACLR